MSTVPPANGRPLLVRLFARWSQLLVAGCPPGVWPLLRLEQGAQLVREERGEAVTGLMEPLLAAAAARLHVAPDHLAAAALRPKLRAALRLGAAGLVAELRYYGVPPADIHLRGAYAAAGTPALALPPVTVRDEVCLRAAWPEPARETSLVQVLAGRREVALPMSAVVRAVSEDTVDRSPEHTWSLAHCLHEEPVPAALGRPALLLLRRRGPAVALKVESLVGHGRETVLPAGPLLEPVPWLLGVVAREAAAPVLVVDPLALVGASRHPT